MKPALWIATTIFLSLVWSPSMLADESKAFVGMGIHAGKGNVSGDLETTSDITVRGTEVLFGGGEKEGVKFHTFFSMPFSTITFKHTGNQFPFNNEKITASRSAIIPNICYKAVWEISGCLGIGFQNIDVIDDSGENRQKYGTIGGQVRLGRFSGDGVIGGVVMDYFEIEERRNGVRSKSNFVPIVAMLGYQIHIESKK